MVLPIKKCYTYTSKELYNIFASFEPLYCGNETAIQDSLQMAMKAITVKIWAFMIPFTHAIFVKKHKLCSGINNFMQDESKVEIRL